MKTTAEMQVKYVHHCGDDLTPVNSARKSFGRKSDWLKSSDDLSKEDPLPENYKVHNSYILTPQGNKILKKADLNLLKYLVRGIPTSEYQSLLSSLQSSSDIDEIEKALWKFRKTPEHDTPYNHNFLTLELEAPIFCHRQIIKHEYMICSEFSRRYITDDLKFYLPLVHRYAAADVKQGSSSEFINTETLENLLNTNNDSTINSILIESQNLYENLIDKHSYNICPEQARAFLPLCLMTSWTWSGTLGAFTKMCNLRLDPHTQQETRLIAQDVRNILYDLYPVSARLLIDPTSIL